MGGSHLSRRAQARRRKGKRFDDKTLNRSTALCASSV
jgi:hypothetical protein